MSIIGSGLAVEVSAPIAGGPNDTSTRTPAEAARNWRRDRRAVLTGDAANRRREHWVRAMLKSALWTWNRQLLVVELVALRRVAPRRAAQGTIKRKRPSGAAHPSAPRGRACRSATSTTCKRCLIRLGVALHPARLV